MGEKKVIYVCVSALCYAVDEACTVTCTQEDYEEDNEIIETLGCPWRDSMFNAVWERKL